MIDRHRRDQKGPGKHASMTACGPSGIGTCSGCSPCPALPFAVVGRPIAFKCPQISSCTAGQGRKNGGRQAGKRMLVSAWQCSTRLPGAQARGGAAGCVLGHAACAVQAGKRGTQGRTRLGHSRENGFKVKLRGGEGGRKARQGGAEKAGAGAGPAGSALLGGRMPEGTCVRGQGV